MGHTDNAAICLTRAADGINKAVQRLQAADGELADAQRSLVEAGDRYSSGEWAALLAQASEMRAAAETALLALIDPVSAEAARLQGGG